MPKTTTAVRKDLPCGTQYMGEREESQSRKQRRNQLFSSVYFSPSNPLSTQNLYSGSLLCVIRQPGKNCPSQFHTLPRAHTVAESWPLCTYTELNLRDRVLGEAEKKRSIALPSKGGYSRVMPSKCVPSWTG